MLRLNIKTRILLFVVVFEIIAYSSIQLFNNFTYKKELKQLTLSEISQIFLASSREIERLSQLMEHTATSLAISGEFLYSIATTEQVTLERLQQESKQLLVKNFASLPEAIGGGLWYEPFVLQADLKYFGPYAFSHANNIEFTWDLNTPEYDYHNQDWYTLVSQNSWGRAANGNNGKLRPVIWTQPYFDDAGTYSLMMTVDVVMQNQQRQAIGMATVDWSLNALTNTLEQIKISTNSIPFFIHKKSNSILSYPNDPKLVMQNVDNLPWDTAVFSSNFKKNSLQLLDVSFEAKLYKLYFIETRGGFIFGSLSPVSDLEQQVETITKVTLIAGFGIGLVFIILMLFLMRILFSPFDKVLKLIETSVQPSIGTNKDIVISAISYNERNEFTPIIRCLNEVYHKINGYMFELNASHEQVVKSQSEVKLLNMELESKVDSRTAQLRAKSDEAMAALQKLKDTQLKLVESKKHAALGRLVTGIAHEINTPLGIAVSSASFVEEKIKSFHNSLIAGKISKKEFRDNLDSLEKTLPILMKNLRRTSNLVISFKQIAVDQSCNKLFQFNLCQHLNNIFSSLQIVIEKQQHQLQIICPDSESEMQITSNPEAITQVITAIVDNALTHGLKTCSDGVITIKVYSHKQQVVLEITDNGVGMATGVKEFIFDPFFTTTRGIGSMGLGMHVVFNIVTMQLNGNISCNSEQGKGSSFIISLPMTRSSECDHPSS